MSDRVSILASLRSDLKSIILDPEPRKEEDERRHLESFAERICEAAEAEALTLYRKVGDENIFYYIYYHPSLLHSVYSSPAMVACLKEKLVGYRLPAGTGIVGEVIKSGKPCIFSKDFNRGKMLDLSEYTGFPVSSMATLPLAVRHPIGALQILNKNRYSDRFKFIDDDLPTLEPLADLLSVLLAKYWNLLDESQPETDPVVKVIDGDPEQG